jgi:hypothetical protein
MTPHQNSEWQGRVATMLGWGLGCEDIAVRMKCSADDVRREVAILRQEGRLAEVLKLRKGAK